MIEVVIFDDDLNMVASGQIEELDELEYQYCRVLLCEFGSYHKIESFYVQPCGEPLGFTEN